MIQMLVSEMEGRDQSMVRMKYFQDLKYQEIADKLFNSEKTIKAHIYHMFQKLNVKNRLSLVTRAKELGFIEN